MIPSIHPEFVEALKSLTNDRLAKDTPPAVSPKPVARKRKDRLTPLWRVTGRLRSLIVVAVTAERDAGRPRHRP
jgi:hypothetical protein